MLVLHYLRFPDSCEVLANRDLPSIGCESRTSTSCCNEKDDVDSHIQDCELFASKSRDRFPKENFWLAYLVFRYFKENGILIPAFDLTLVMSSIQEARADEETKQTAVTCIYPFK